MLTFISKFSRTIWKPVCHGKGSIYNSNVPKTTFKLSNVCSYGNIPTCKNNIKVISGASENSKMLSNAFEINNGFVNESRSYIYVTHCQKCSFHSSSSVFSKGHTEYQDKEKREANILIGISVAFISLVIFGAYVMDMSPYDKPSMKVEKSQKQNI